MPRRRAGETLTQTAILFHLFLPIGQEMKLFVTMVLRRPVERGSRNRLRPPRIPKRQVKSQKCTSWMGKGLHRAAQCRVDLETC